MADRHFEPGGCIELPGRKGSETPDGGCMGDPLKVSEVSKVKTLLPEGLRAMVSAGPGRAVSPVPSKRSCRGASKCRKPWSKVRAASVLWPDTPLPHLHPCGSL